MTAIVGALLERPTIYRLWQLPFAGAKLGPFLRHNENARLGRVLDVGCGPGTNARHFAGTAYLGVDINPKYIAYARRRFPGRFEVADAAHLSLVENQKFDCIIVNSLLHHLEDSVASSLLENLCSSLSAEGSIHILELVEPEGRGIDAFLAKADRGRFSRSRGRWEDLLRQFYELVVVEPYTLRVAGLVLWNMIYLKGRPR